MDTPDRGNGHARLADSTSQAGRRRLADRPLRRTSNWYPAIEARRVRRTPVPLMMLGDDLVLFRDKAGRVAALSDWCPHRGARLSLGVCEFEGTVTCPHHEETPSTARASAWPP